MEKPKARGAGNEQEIARRAHEKMVADEARIAAAREAGKSQAEIARLFEASQKADTEKVHAIRKRVHAPAHAEKPAAATRPDELEALRTRMVAEARPKKQSLMGRFKNFWNKLNGKGAAPKQAEEEPIRIPMRKMSEGVRELGRDIRAMGRNLGEMREMAGISHGAVERSRRELRSQEKEEREWAELKGPDFEKNNPISEEPIEIPMEGRTESLLRDAAAAIMPGVENLPEKQTRQQRKKAGVSLEEFEESFTGEKERQHKEHVKKQTDEAVALHEAIEEHNAEEERKTKAKRAPKQPSAAQLAHEASMAQEKNELHAVDEGWDKIAALEDKKKKDRENIPAPPAEIMAAGKKFEEDAVTRSELVMLARGKRSSDPNLVNELNTKTKDAFFPDAASIWEDALKASQEALKAQGIDKASKAEAMATSYVMSMARLKAAEMTGIKGNDLAELRKAVENEQAGKYLETKKIEAEKAREAAEAEANAEAGNAVLDELELQDRLKERRNMPIEATPKQKKEGTSEEPIPPTQRSPGSSKNRNFAKSRVEHAGKQYSKKEVKIEEKSAEQTKEQSAKLADEIEEMTVKMEDAERKTKEEANSLKREETLELLAETLPGARELFERAYTGLKGSETRRSSGFEDQMADLAIEYVNLVARLKSAREFHKVPRLLAELENKVNKHKAHKHVKDLTEQALAASEAVKKSPEKDWNNAEEALNFTVYATGGKPMDTAAIDVLDNSMGGTWLPIHAPFHKAMVDAGNEQLADDYLKALAQRTMAERVGLNRSDKKAFAALDEKVESLRKAGNDLISPRKGKKKNMA